MTIIERIASIVTMGGLPLGGLALVSIIAIIVFFITPGYKRRDNSGSWRIAGGRIGYIPLSIFGTISLILGIIGLIRRHNPANERLDVLTAHAIMHAELLNFRMDFRAYRGLMTGYAWQLILFGAIAVGISIAMYKVRKQVLLHWRTRTDVSVAWYRTQRVLNALLPVLIMIATPNLLGGHLLDIENPGLYMATVGLDAKDMTDGRFYQMLSIYILTFGMNYICLPYWITISRIPATPQGKVKLGLITLPACLALEYFLIRFFYIVLSMLLPTIITLVVMTIFFAILGFFGGVFEAIFPESEGKKERIQENYEKYSTLTELYPADYVADKMRSELTFMDRMALQYDTDHYDQKLDSLLTGMMKQDLGETT